jgi:endoglucanase
MRFLRAAGEQIVDETGEPVHLRGVGLGNWLLPEGYMWKFEPPGPQSPREIEALVRDLAGTERASAFWQGFRDRFITEADIARIAAEGFNHVRLPINWRVLVEEGFEVVDRLIDWCRDHGIWVVLDLHGAPGGQTGTNIDDSLGTPALFEDEANWKLTVELWRQLASRYRDEPVVAAYDLLNEPLPNEYQHTYADRLVALYKELTAAIREIDLRHIIMYEGSHWASNWSIFTEVWDANSVLQFHKYWSPPDRPSIQRFIDVGTRLGLPIYMGEGGENTPAWLQTAFQLYEDCGIGWNFWPWKKIDTLSSPCSIDPPDGWLDVVAYAAGKGPRPSDAPLWKLLDNMDISRCSCRPEVVNAIMRRPPLRVPATGFTFHGAGVSYQTAGATPLPTFRSDDAVTVTGRPDFDFPPREQDLHVVLQAGEWLAYQHAGSDPVEVVTSADKPVSVTFDRDTVRVTSVEPDTRLYWLEIKPFA